MDWINGYFKTSFYRKSFDFRLETARTIQEVEGIIKLLQPWLGAHILDWCGGWGRHAIELVKRGFKVTLLDFAPNHISMAKGFAKKAGVELKCITADFRETPPEIQADFAINIFTAGLGYLTEEDDLQALSSLHVALKPGGKLLVDTINLFWLVANYEPRGYHPSEDRTRQVIDKRKFDFWTNRNHSRTIYDEVGRNRREQTSDLRIYSAAELAAVLRRAGFEPLELYGGFDGREFTFNFNPDDPEHECKRIVMIAKKV